MNPNITAIEANFDLIFGEQSNSRYTFTDVLQLNMNKRVVMWRQHIWEENCITDKAMQFNIAFYHNHTSFQKQLARESD